MNTAASRSSESRQLRGRHVLFWVLGFFAVVVGVDSLFVVWAVDSFPGQVSPKPYEDGLAFNSAIARRRAQDSLGWTARVVQGGSPGAISVRILDRDGRPLPGLAVKARFVRPATETGARAAALTAAADGEYAGAARLAPGAWDLTVTATSARNERFEARRRLVWR